MANNLNDQLRARFGQAEPKNSPTSGDVYGELVALIRKISGVEEGLDPDADLREIGVSSLDYIELTVRAEERFKVRLDGDVMHGLSTLGQVARYIEEQQ